VSAWRAECYSEWYGEAIATKLIRLPLFVGQNIGLHYSPLLSVGCSLMCSMDIRMPCIGISAYEIEIYFNLQMGFTRWQYHYDNTTHQIHLSHKITPLKTKHISSQSYTNIDGHITVNQYSVEKGKEIKLSLIQALEAY
jgi:hypothetical protein